MFKSLLVFVFGVMISSQLALADAITGDEAAKIDRQNSYNSCMAARGSQADCKGELAGASEQTDINTAPGTGSDDSKKTGGNKKSAKQAAAAKGAAQKEAIKDYVNLHKVNGFDLGRLNSDREATLVISNSNAENNLVFRIIRLIAMLVGTVAILLYIVAGYFMIFSMGDENSLTKGKQIVTYTSLGLVIAFTAYMIVQLVMGLMYFAG